MQPVYGQALEPISSFPAPGSNIQGLAFGNGILFAVNRDASTQSTIFKLNPTDGSIISSFNDPTLATGLAHDGTKLWTTRDSGTCAPPPACNFIHRLNPADGTVELTISIDVTGGTGGLAFLDGSLWVVGAFGSFSVEILEVRPTDGATLSHFDVDTLGISPREFDADGTNLLYGTGVSDFKVFKISTAGTVIDSDILFTVEVDINGLAFGDNRLYVADRASNQIFVFSFIPAPPPPNQSPIANANGPYSGNEGQTIQLDGTGSSDPDNNISTYEWDLDGDLAFDDATGPTPNVNLVDGNAIINIGLRVTDSGGLSDTATSQIIISNVAPSVIAGSPATINEGDTFNGGGSFTDPGVNDAPWSATVDYGDGSGVQPLTLSPTKTFSLSNTYADNGTPIVEVRVTDKDGGTGSASFQVTVNNVAPSCSTITAPLDPVQVGTLVQPSASFTDSGILDTHSAVWSWGDTTTSTGTVVQGAGSGTVSGSHTYTAAGINTLTLTVTDDDGGSCQQIFQFVVVFDPEGEFVTGGGWIDSPANAYRPDPSLTGKANFGFVSKYQKGATEPIGETEFQFKVADLNFHSDSYQWLVIGGPKATYKGDGTINGGGNYGFLLSAIDEKLTPSTDDDLFRIKIWDKDNGDAIVYDNKVLGDVGDDADPTTAIGGGSIVIHKAK